MTKTSSWVLLFFLMNGPGISEPIQGNLPKTNNRTEAQQNPKRQQERNGFSAVQDMVEGFYISRLQKELELSDTQFSKILKPVRESLRRRTNLSRQRFLAVRAVRKALSENATDEKIMEHIQAIDTAELRLRNVQSQLLQKIDPALTPVQRAHLRIIQMNLERRIRNMIDQARNQAPARIGGPPGK